MFFIVAFHMLILCNSCLFRYMQRQGVDFNHCVVLKSIFSLLLTPVIRFPSQLTVCVTILLHIVSIGLCMHYVHNCHHNYYDY
jgi:hypothetical protein